MAKAIFGPFHWRTEGWSHHFDAPVQVLSTSDKSEIPPLLASLEREAQAGAWIAVLLSYEAAAAFDRSLQTKSTSDFPLLWAAVFEKPSSAQARPSTYSFQISDWQPAILRADYSSAVSRIRELIAAGDTYQVNYTFPLHAEFAGDALSWYVELCKAQTADYCAFLDLGRHSILSLSPELFFERVGNTVTTRPMKGTINRGRWSSEDQDMAAALMNSQKDRAENVMIVDLLRNDLGRVSVPGTVEVTNLFDLERYETLWQMTSTVKSELRADVGLAEMLAALFPCGSITGAPKIRTMEIIKELEQFPRGPYCGAIGLVKPGGDCTFNVAIRTVVIDNDTGAVTYGVGGGITYDSTADREYEECLLKSSFLNRRVPDFELLETMLLADGEVFLLERHLGRLKTSADYFGFVINLERTREEISKVASECGDVTCKIRLLLERDGLTNVEALPLEVLSTPMKVAVAEKPVHSTDVFLFHKTTNRSVYEEAMSSRDDVDDVLLWNEHGEITESTFANLVVLIAGKWFTPPRECGLLAGTFREELLVQGAITERVILLSDLQEAEEISLINSVRKWIPVSLVDVPTNVAKSRVVKPEFQNRLLDLHDRLK